MELPQSLSVWAASLSLANLSLSLPACCPAMAAFDIVPSNSPLKLLLCGLATRSTFLGPRPRGPHESSGDSSNQPNGPMGSPRCSLDPLGPLNRSLGLIGLFRSPRLPYKSAEDPSNVVVNPMGHPVDPKGHLTPPLDLLGPCRRNPWPPGAL